MRTLPAAVALLAILSGCMTPPEDESEMLARMAAEHQLELELFQAEQADFLRRNPMAQRREFPGLGTLVIDEVELVGRPGKAWVRAHFTFINSSSVGFEGVRVSLYVRDPTSREAWSEALEMHGPFGLRAGDESTYTAALKTPTRGVELLDGWTWDLVLEPRPSALP